MYNAQIVTVAMEWQKLQKLIYFEFQFVWRNNSKNEILFTSLIIVIKHLTKSRNSYFIENLLRYYAHKYIGLPHVLMFPWICKKTNYGITYWYSLRDIFKTTINYPRENFIFSNSEKSIQILHCKVIKMSSENNDFQCNYLAINICAIY